MSDWAWSEDGDDPQESRDWEVCDHGRYFEDPCEDCIEEAAEEAE